MHQHNPLSVEKKKERKKESNPVIYTWKNYAGEPDAKAAADATAAAGSRRPQFHSKEEMIPIRLHVHSISGRVFVTDKRITKGRGWRGEKRREE